MDDAEERHEQILYRLEKLEKSIFAMDSRQVYVLHDFTEMKRQLRDTYFFCAALFFGVPFGVLVWLLGDYGHYALWAYFIFAISFTIRNWYKHKRSQRASQVQPQPGENRAETDRTISTADIA